MKFSIAASTILLLLTFQQVNSGFVTKKANILECGQLKYQFELYQLTFTKTGQLQILAKQLKPDDGKKSSAPQDLNSKFAQDLHLSTSRAIVRISFPVTNSKFGRQWQESFTGLSNISYVQSSAPNIPDCLKIIIQLEQKENIRGRSPSNRKDVVVNEAAFPTMPRAGENGSFMDFGTIQFQNNLSWFIRTEDIEFNEQQTTVDSFAVDGESMQLTFLSLRFKVPMYPADFYA